MINYIKIAVFNARHEFNRLRNTLKIIADFLCVVDRMSLAVAFCTTRQYLKIQPDDINQVEDKLGELGFFDDICQELKTSNKVIAGSFVLRCLFDTNWKSGVDVFCISECIIPERIGNMVCRVKFCWRILRR